MTVAFLSLNSGVVSLHLKVVSFLQQASSPVQSCFWALAVTPIIIKIGNSLSRFIFRFKLVKLQKILCYKLLKYYDLKELGLAWQAEFGNDHLELAKEIKAIMLKS